MADQYQSIPVAVARAAVQASGELEGIEGPLFMADVGEQWEPFFSRVNRVDEAHPAFAKVTVTRKGQKPREVVISWDEYAEQMDADPEWDAIRASKPMSIFGAEVERHAYRVVFADVLAALEPPKITKHDVYPAHDPNPWEPVETERDWRGEIESASASALNALYDDARRDGALVRIGWLQQAFTDRMLELSAAPKPAVIPKPVAPPRDRPNRRQGRRRVPA